jgi:DNA-binding XRE family transcriptional regulator
LRGDAEAVAAQFGHNLAEARGWENLTQGELAQRACLAKHEVAKMEIGIRCPRLDKVVKLADAVGLQVRDLLYGIE